MHTVYCWSSQYRVLAGSSMGVTRTPPYAIHGMVRAGHVMPRPPLNQFCSSKSKRSRNSISLFLDLVRPFALLTPSTDQRLASTSLNLCFNLSVLRPHPRITQPLAHPPQKASRRPVPAPRCFVGDPCLEPPSHNAYATSFKLRFSRRRHQPGP